MFGGFRATMNLFGGKKNRKEGKSDISQYSVTGAYRTSRDDSFGYNNSFEQTKTAASQPVLQQIRPTKSTSDLTKVKHTAAKTRNSIPEISRDPRGAEQIDLKNGSQITKNQEKEQKRLEKQRLSKQKAREKQAAQEQAKQEKLRKERERKEAEKQKRRPNKKRQAPKPQAPQPASMAAPAQYSTNTLESSISRSSGPPPYSEVPNPIGVPQNATDKSGNVTYSKPEDTGSWDMISQHREQMIRPTTTIGSGKQSKQMVMDLNYNYGGQTSQSKDNSDA